MSIPRNPIHWHSDEFPQRVEDARKVFNGGNDSPEIHLETAWDLLTRGQQLGRVVPINFLEAGNGGLPSQQGSAEVLRIVPKSGGQENRCTIQGCVTLAPPAIIPSGNLNAGTQGYQDAINVTLSGNVAGIGGFMGGKVANPQPIAGFSYRVPWSTAIVQWGIGSIVNRAECDLVNGLCLNLSFSHLIVTAFVQKSPIHTSSDGTYVLGASVGPGYPKPNNAQLTICVGGVANGAESNVFTVPRFAKSVRMAMTDGAGTLGTGVLRFRGDSDGLNIPIAEYTFAGNNPVSYPIPSGALFFTVIGGYASVGPLGNPVYSGIFDLAV